MCLLQQISCGHEASVGAVLGAGPRSSILPDLNGMSLLCSSKRWEHDAGCGCQYTLSAAWHCGSGARCKASKQYRGTQLQLQLALIVHTIVTPCNKQRQQ
jgi:hypothetical protein